MEAEQPETFRRHQPDQLLTRATMGVVEVVHQTFPVAVAEVVRQILLCILPY